MDLDFGILNYKLMKKGKLRFVVHKHDARNLHYDFRLQIGNGMPSWAIPKGPTLDSSVKRLAVETSVHSLEYKNFEGVIEDGKYGAGPVMIWDEGTYKAEREKPPKASLATGGGKGEREIIENTEEAEEEMEEGLKKGEIKFFLEGTKLKGSFALVRTKGFPPGVKNAWLLIKHKDEFAKEGYDAKDYDFSVKSGKKLKEI